MKLEVPTCRVCNERRAKFSGDMCMICYQYDSACRRATEKATKLYCAKEMFSYLDIVRHVFNTNALRPYLQMEFFAEDMAQFVREDIEKMASFFEEFRREASRI